MAITFNDNLRISAPKDVDNRKGKIVFGNQVPFESIDEALTLVDISTRFLGLTVRIYVDGELKEYWFRDDLETLVEKSGNFIKASPDEPQDEYISVASFIESGAHVEAPNFFQKASNGLLRGFQTGEFIKLGRVETFNYDNQSSIAGFKFHPTYNGTEIPLSKGQLRFVPTVGFYQLLESNSYEGQRLIVEEDLNNYAKLTGTVIQTITNPTIFSGSSFYLQGSDLIQDLNNKQLLLIDASDGKIQKTDATLFARRAQEVKTNFNTARPAGIYTIEGGNDDIANAPDPTVHSWSFIQADSGIPSRTAQLAIDNFSGKAYSRASNGTWIPLSGESGGGDLQSVLDAGNFASQDITLGSGYNEETGTFEGIRLSGGGEGVSFLDHNRYSFSPTNRLEFDSDNGTYLKYLGKGDEEEAGFDGSQIQLKDGRVEVRMPIEMGISNRGYLPVGVGLPSEMDDAVNVKYLNESYVQSLPLYDNIEDIENLPDWTRYRTSSGHLMYKVPSITMQVSNQTSSPVTFGDLTLPAGSSTDKMVVPNESYEFKRTDANPYLEDVTRQLYSEDKPLTLIPVENTEIVLKDINAQTYEMSIDFVEIDEGGGSNRKYKTTIWRNDNNGGGDYEFEIDWGVQYNPFYAFLIVKDGEHFTAKIKFDLTDYPNKQLVSIDYVNNAGNQGNPYTLPVIKSYPAVKEFPWDDYYTFKMPIGDFVPPEPNYHTHSVFKLNTVNN